MSLFSSQAEYEAYHSPEAKRARTEAIQQASDDSLNEANELFCDGDEDGARQSLLDGGFDFDATDSWIDIWSGDD